MENMETKFSKNIDVENLKDYLKDGEIGKTYTYMELKDKCINKDSWRFSLNYAIKKLRGLKIIYHNIRNVGYKRVTAEEILLKNPKFFEYAKRRLKHGSQEIVSVNDNELTNEQKIKRNTLLAQNGVLLHLMKPKQMGIVEQGVIKEQKKFNPAESLKYLVNS